MYNQGYQKNYQKKNYSPRGNDQHQGPQKKRSGCTAGTYTTSGKGLLGSSKTRNYVRGWKFTKQGMTTILCAPYKNTEEHKSKSGRVWENWLAKVQVGNSEPYNLYCLYDKMSGKVIVKELGYVLNPKGGKGGYCGTFVNK